MKKLSIHQISDYENFIHNATEQIQMAAYFAFKAHKHKQMKSGEETEYLIESQKCVKKSMNLIKEANKIF